MQEFVVEEDLGVSIQPFKYQLQTVALEHLGRDIEGSLIFPIGLAYPLQFLFVVAIEGIVDQLIVEQVSVNATWNVRRIPGISANFAKLPASQERHSDL